MYDFGKVIDRKGTDSSKWDLIESKGFDKDVLPMWVADMDFETLPEVTQRLKEIVDRNIYGYTVVPDRYYNAVINWMKDRHDFEIKKEWITITPGVVTALKMAVNAFTNVGDKVIIHKPVYYPFDFSIELNNRVIVENPMIYKDGEYSCDFDAFEKAIIENDVKLFILCNPYNPIGKVWKKDELQQLGDICKKHGVIVVSDEIHMDFVFEGSKHIPFYNVDESFKEFSIVCTAPSKTFNLAGLQTSNIIIANEEMKKKYDAIKASSGIVSPNLFGMEACLTAYTYGHQWVNELVSYIHENVMYMKKFFEEKLPEIKVIVPEGLYLVWVDFSALGLDKDELEKFMLEEAKLWLDEGYIFGTGGAGFERFNLACPRSTVEDALNRIEKAIKNRSDK